VSPASFSGCVFLMSSLEPDLCSSVGSFMTRVSLWWRSLVLAVICCRGRGKFPMKVRVYSLHALVPMTAFSRCRFRLVSVWVFVHSLPL
jgi:hypothetical protein